MKNSKLWIKFWIGSGCLGRIRYDTLQDSIEFAIHQLVSLSVCPSYCISLFFTSFLIFIIYQRINVCKLGWKTNSMLSCSVFPIYEYLWKSIFETLFVCFIGKIHYYTGVLLWGFIVWCLIAMGYKFIKLIQVCIASILTKKLLQFSNFSLFSFFSWFFWDFFVCFFNFFYFFA